MNARPGRLFVELCSASAAVSLHLLGCKPLMPYMGSKSRYAAAIARHAQLERPSRVVLVDVGPWPRLFSVLVDAGKRDRVATKLGHYAAGDPKALWSWLRAEPVPEDDVLFAAAFLTLQRWAFRGKPVMGHDGRWRDPGFGKTEAYGAVATERFGAVRPQLPSLARRVAAFPSLPLEAVTADIREVDLEALIEPGNTTVYCDFPYIGTTGYGSHDPNRADQVRVLDSCVRAGADVVASERVPLSMPGWSWVEITDERSGKRSSVQTPEWLSCSPGVLEPVQERR